MPNSSDCFKSHIKESRPAPTKKGRKKNKLSNNYAQTPPVDSSVDYDSPIVDIMVFDSGSSPDRKIKCPQSKISQKAKNERTIENTSYNESDFDSKAEISVGGPDDLGSLSDGSPVISPVKRKLEGSREEIFAPFSEKRRTSLLRRVLRLSAEEFIRIHVYLKKIPVVNLMALFDIDIPKAFFSYKETDLVPILRAIIHQSTRTRPKLLQYNTIDDCVSLIKRAKKIVVLTGAGVSVSCGIPDFRSENGIYSRLDEFDLNDPQQMFCLDHFRYEPKCFYSFAKEIYPSNFKPSPSHKFIKLLEDRGKLLRNYTQNIDTLEQAAGITRVIQCHGSFATASCIRCHYTFPGTFIEDNIANQTVPNCPLCEDGICDQVDERFPGVIKPDIVFFGEGLPEEYGAHLKEDRVDADLLIVMGTSLKVRPVSEIASILPPHVPSILINRTPNTSIDFDIQLLGFSDVIVTELSAKLGWDLSSCADNSDSPDTHEWDSLRKPPHWHLFTGAQTEELLAEGLSFTPDCSSSSSSEEEIEACLLLDRKSHSFTPLLPTPPLASGLATRESSPREDSSSLSVAAPCAPIMLPQAKRRKVSVPPHHVSSPLSCLPQAKSRQKRRAHYSSEEINVDDSPVYSKNAH